jgi:hypothetical protein
LWAWLSGIAMLEPYPQPRERENVCVCISECKPGRERTGAWREKACKGGTVAGVAQTGTYLPTYSRYLLISEVGSRSSKFQFFSCCSKSGDQPQEDLAKSGYNTNHEVENLGILLHLG